MPDPAPATTASAARPGRPASATGGAFPRIVVNAKTYPQATGHAAVTALAKACQDVGARIGEPIGLAPPMVELATVGRLALPDVVVLAQHVDALQPGAGTGWVTVEGIAGAGAAGSLLNHAEHKLPHDQLAAIQQRLRGAGLLSLVCADSMAEVRKLAPLGPTALAIEPPELIGGNVSVTSADPAIVREAAAATRKAAPATLPLCGAGVKGAGDVAAALRLGAHGVLLASGVAAAKDPAKALADLAVGLD